MEEKRTPQEQFAWDVEDKLTMCDTLEEAEDALEKFGTIKFVDEKIDDGLDDDCEDEYLMLRCYNLYPTDTSLKSCYVKLYYGNNTMELGTFDVQY